MASAARSSGRNITARIGKKRWTNTDRLADAGTESSLAKPQLKHEERATRIRIAELRLSDIEATTGNGQSWLLCRH
jgi:hypothetical protein